MKERKTNHRMMSILWLAVSALAVANAILHLMAEKEASEDKAE